MKPLRICIGYDSREPAAFHVLAHSLLTRSSRPLSIVPIHQAQLRGLNAYRRLREANESTEFSMTRFLSPWLCDFEGIVIFMDCDMLCLADIAELEDLALSDPSVDVFVAKHVYTPSTNTKFLGQPQAVYPRKNWSSVMVFNCWRMPVRRLTPEYVNTSTPSAMHQLEWANHVGDLPLEWNHLVTEYPPNPGAKLVHFTLGGPWFPEYRECEYAAAWFAEAGFAMAAAHKPIFQLPQIGDA